MARKVSDLSGKDTQTITGEWSALQQERQLMRSCLSLFYTDGSRQLRQALKMPPRFCIMDKINGENGEVQRVIRVAIVEDEKAVQEQLADYIKRYTRQYGTEFEVKVFGDGVDILDDYRPVYDLILLDVEMKHLDGMETAQRIRALDHEVTIIFITNMAQYAINGYAVGALDYVLKPVPYFAFSQQLKKVEAQLHRRVRHHLAVPVEGGLRRLDTANIYYIESEGHKVHFYTEDGELTAPGALKTLEEKLAGQPFARCNSGYLVNLAQVKAVQQNTVEVGPYELQVSRPRRKAFLAALTDYIGGEGAG